MPETARGVGVLLALVLTIMVGVWPSPARADGDPASDVLANQALFLPADAGISVREQLRLAALVDVASHDGLPIRVAIISSPSDLGAVSGLWDRPRAYARFLGIELSLVSHDRLLTVMPDGVGYYYPGRSPAAVDGLVDRIPSGRSGPALVSAAQTGVMSVAKAARVRLVALGGADRAGVRAPTQWRPTTDRVFGLAVLAVLAAVCAACLVFSRGRSAVLLLVLRARRRVSRAHVPREPL